MMDSYMYTQVIDKVLSQAVCPRCGASVRESAYDILSINHQRMVLELDCEECGAVVTLTGAFQRKQTTHQRRQQQSVVSPETVREIRQVLQSFQGENVQDLLNK